MLTIFYLVLLKLFLLFLLICCPYLSQFCSHAMCFSPSKCTQDHLGQWHLWHNTFVWVAHRPEYSNFSWFISCQFPFIYTPFQCSMSLFLQLTPWRHVCQPSSWWRSLVLNLSGWPFTLCTLQLPIQVWYQSFARQAKNLTSFLFKCSI